MPLQGADAQKPFRPPAVLAMLLWLIGWLWAIAAGGGGIWYLWTKGPWLPTNGWFALASGISACPLTAWFLKKYAGVTVSPYVQLSVAALVFVAGKIALAAGI